jgi:hypothetical protein
MQTTGETLLSIVNGVVPEMKQISESDARIERGPGKWSRIEIVGHLIDSANNNHRRFVLANSHDNLVFDGYIQDQWVAIQDYQHQDWIWLIDFWANYNRLIARLIDRVPDPVKLKQHTNHCLHGMAWKTVPEDEPATLDYLMKDYVGHLEHHVCQILPKYQPVVIGTY